MPATYGTRVRSTTRVLLSVALCGTLCLVQPASAGEKIGVVLMHGEQGAPGRLITGLGQALEHAGYLVGRPDMCWSARRGYEEEFPSCLSAIDTAIVKLRNLGATAIVVAGFSLGGTAAIAYGADHPGYVGVIAIAPDHDARVAAIRPEIAESIAHARQLVATGKGDETATFTDVTIGPTGVYETEVATSPAIYLSFFGADSRASIQDNIGKLTAPLLWVAGTEDPGQGSGATKEFEHAPANPLNRFILVTGGHLGTPDAAKASVLAWLRGLAGQ